MSSYICSAKWPDDSLKFFMIHSSIGIIQVSSTFGNALVEKLFIFDKFLVEPIGSNS